MLEQSQLLLLKIDHMQWSELKIQIYDPSFPLCTDVLIEFFGKIVPHTQDKYWDFEWTNKLKKHRSNGGFALMDYMAYNINYFSERMAANVMQQLNGHFKDTCPPQYLHTIMSPNGQTDWSRAVWCIYSELKKRGFTLPFTTDVIPKMEEWLTRPHRIPFPDCITILISVYDNLKLHSVTYGVRELPETAKDEWMETLKDYRKNGDDVSLMTYVAKKLNFYARRNQYASEIPFPPEYRDTILSPDGKTDWSYAVWCIYQDLKRPMKWMLQFNFVFDVDILTKLEVWLTSEDYFSHPNSPRERSPSRAPVASASPPRSQKPGGYRKSDLSKLLNDLQMMGQCS